MNSRQLEAVVVAHRWATSPVQQICESPAYFRLESRESGGDETHDTTRDLWGQIQTNASFGISAVATRNSRILPRVAE